MRRELRKRTAILAKTDWLSMLNLDTLHHVLSHLQIDSIIKLRELSRSYYSAKVNQCVLWILMMVVQQDIPHGIVPWPVRMSKRINSCASKKKLLLNRFYAPRAIKLIRHSETATQLDDLRRVYFESCDHHSLAADHCVTFLNDYIDRCDHYLANGQFQELAAYRESTLERRNMLENEMHVWRAKWKLALVEYTKAKRKVEKLSRYIAVGGLFRGVTLRSFAIVVHSRLSRSW